MATATAKTEKTVNYTPEMEVRLLEVYDPKADQDTRKEQVESLAAEFGKTSRSISSKLSRMGVYVKATYQSKTGEAPQDKAHIVDRIAALCTMTENDADSLTKANKAALLAIAAALEVERDNELIASMDTDESADV